MKNGMKEGGQKNKDTKYEEKGRAKGRKNEGKSMLVFCFFHPQLIVI